MSKSSTINTAWDMGVDVTYKLLIENLGGYDAAKAKLRDNGSLHSERLKKAILEYRRQHNIFEVGDLVVLLHTNYRSDVFALTKSFKEIYDEKGICYRHAADEEIAAGKRL